MGHAAAIAGAVLRAALAAALVWLCWQDLPAARARAEFAALPEFDYWREAESLLRQERYSEALLVADAGLAALPDQDRPPLVQLREQIERERGAFLNRVQQIGRGALLGTGDSAEALGGAIAADLFVFGDVRDLVIQGGRKLRGEDTDPVIVALSAGGILLTVNPALDLGAALLKFARRIGAMSERFAQALLERLQSALRRQNADEALEVTGDMAALAGHARPAGALAILRHVDTPADLRRAAQFARQPGGAFALWVGGRPALDWLASGADVSGEWLLKAARKGRAGMEMLVRQGPLLLRPHPLTGLLKGLYKGNIPALLAEWLQRVSETLLGLAVGWLLYETLRAIALVARLRRGPAR